MSLTRRTQVLLDDEQYERLRRHAEASGASVGALVREAIDHTYPALPAERRRAAADFLRAVRAAAPEAPQEDWEVIKERLGNERAGLGDRAG